MKLDLSAKQRKALQMGKSIQLKHDQIGRGMNMNLHPMNEKKIIKAYQAGKGVRVGMSGGELGMDMEGGKLSANKVLKRIGIKKDVNQGIKKAAPVLRAVNKGLKDAGLDSIQEVAITQAVDLLPIPSIAKQILAKQATNQVDKLIAGAGIKKTINRGLKKAGIKKDVYDVAKQVNKKNINRALNYTNNVLTNNGYDNIEDIVLDNVTNDRRLKGVAKDLLQDGLEGGSMNPYLPTRKLGRGFKTGGKLPMSGGSAKVYEDHRNILRPGVAGFRADPMFDPLSNPYIFDKKPQTGKGFRAGRTGAGFKN